MVCVKKELTLSGRTVRLRIAQTMPVHKSKVVPAVPSSSGCTSGVGSNPTKRKEKSTNTRTSNARCLVLPLATISVTEFKSALPVNHYTAESFLPCELGTGIQAHCYSNSHTQPVVRCDWIPHEPPASGDPSDWSSKGYSFPTFTEIPNTAGEFARGGGRNHRKSV